MFLPMGIIIGYILYFFFFDQLTISVLREMYIWPFITCIAIAILVALVMTLVKLKYNKYMFEHFYLMMFGMVMMFIGSIFFLLYGKSLKIFHKIKIINNLLYLKIQLVEHIVASSDMESHTFQH